MTKIVLLDDEKHCTDILESLILKIKGDYRVVASFNNSLDALDYIKNNEIDILFLDIQMPKLNGFQLLDKILPIDFDIIFTTAYDQFAIRAFDYSAAYYLLKPITEKALIRAISSWEQRKRKVNSQQWQLLKGALNESDDEIKRIALPTGTGFEIIELDEIERCQSDNNYTSFYFEDGSKILISRTLKEVDDMLSRHGFFRVHQSHLINSRFVKTISRQDGGMIVMQDGTQIPVSRQKKNNLNELLDMMLRF